MPDPHVNPELDEVVDVEVQTLFTQVNPDGQFAVEQQFPAMQALLQTIEPLAQVQVLLIQS